MKRLSKKQMIIFAIGQLGWSMLSGIISAWLVTYYLPSAQDIGAGATQYIHPGLVIGGFMTILGLITALSRIFDAVTDPLIASLSDRSKNPRGRRTPFMQIAAIPLAVVTVLLFCAPFGSHETGNALNIVWISVAIILFYLFMTMYCTPYNALISEYGKTQEDRMFISTAISLTFFAGTLLAYTPFVFAGLLRSSVGFAWSYRICFIVLAVIAAVCMLLPTFLLKEKEFVESKPSNENVFKSLASTFKNKDFRAFSSSDIMYWVGLTMFQTGLPFFVKVSMAFDESMVMVFMGGMTVLSAVFYPFVTKMVKKFGKKKLVIAGFLGLALCYGITAVASIPGVLPVAETNPELPATANGLSWVFGIAVMIISALPMALLGIIPQSIVADVAEAEAVTTGQNREGMFFAARTFAMKFGQSLAMILFTSLAILGTTQATDSNDIVASKFGLVIVAIVAAAFCILGAVLLLFYREKKVMKIIAKEGDEAFMKAIENEKDLGEEKAE
ncbi:MAG: MFS transporter [Bacilli bacterium]|nr:MFS transporter [Bacilli bacterium]